MTKAEAIINEVEAMGGMTKAIEAGMPKLRIEECATRRQARVDRGLEVVVGVNRYRPDHAEKLDTLEVDNREVLANQVARLKKIKSERDGAAVAAALDAITKIAGGAPGNLLEAAVEAARARATVGEISDAMEKIFGRYDAPVRTISNVYASVFEDDENWQKIRARVEAFAAARGRRPRMLVAKMGQDGHDRGAHVVATAYADLGFDVDVGALFATPEEVARQAIENDVHVVGVSTQAAGHKTLVPALIESLKSQGGADIRVVCGGVIPQADYDFLRKAGVAGIFGPGTPILGSAAEILSAIE